MNIHQSLVSAAMKTMVRQQRFTNNIHESWMFMVRKKAPGYTYFHPVRAVSSTNSCTYWICTKTKCEVVVKNIYEKNECFTSASFGRLSSRIDQHPGCPHRLAMAMLFFSAGDIQWYKVLMKSGISTRSYLLSSLARKSSPGMNILRENREFRDSRATWMCIQASKCLQ